MNPIIYLLLKYQMSVEIDESVAVIKYMLKVAGKFVWALLQGGKYGFTLPEMPPDIYDNRP